MRASEPLLHPDGSIDEPTDIQHVELHQLFSQLQLHGGAPDTSTTLIAPPSPGQSSVLTMCYPDEIADYGGIDGVMSSDEYIFDIFVKSKYPYIRRNQYFHYWL